MFLEVFLSPDWYCSHFRIYLGLWFLFHPEKQSGLYLDFCVFRLCAGFPCSLPAGQGGGRTPPPPPPTKRGRTQSPLNQPVPSHASWSFSLSVRWRLVLLPWNCPLSDWSEQFLGRRVVSSLYFTFLWGSLRMFAWWAFSPTSTVWAFYVHHLGC